MEPPFRARCSPQSTRAQFDPGGPASARDGRGLGHERQDDDRFAGRGILSPRIRLAHNSSGANLVSGVASTLLAADGAELGLFEVDEGAFPDVAARVRPRAVCLGNLFRDQLDRYGELERIAERWREAVRALPAGSQLVVNADDPQVGDLATERPETTTFGVDDPAQARPSLQHAADSKYCLRCGTPYAYAAAYVGHLGDYRCPNCGHGRPPLAVSARAIELLGLDSVSFDLVTPEGTRRVGLALPGLYNVYNALAAAALARELGASLDEIEAGLAVRDRRSGASNGSRSATGPFFCSWSRTLPVRTRPYGRWSPAARRRWR